MRLKILHTLGALARRPSIDLQTVFETLSYMHDDVARDPGLKKVADALDHALKEIESVQRRASGSVINTASPTDGFIKHKTSRFIARTERGRDHQ